MYQIGLLILTGSFHMVVKSISQYLKCCNKNVVKRLYIKLEPEFNKPCTCQSDVAHRKRLSVFAPLLYNKASSLCQNLDVRLILSDTKIHKTDFETTTKFDVVLTNSLEDDQNICNYVESNFKGTYNTIIKIPEDDHSNTNIKNQDIISSEYKVYKNVCLGGTFDRLHNGHKVLLSESVLRATNKLIIGVTDKAMLKRKKLYELIEPIDKRISDVTEFLQDVDPSLQYIVVPITDPYGPTITDGDIDCIVVSAETKVGGEKVNVERKNRKMSELDIHVVDLLENTDAVPGEEDKLSSSTRRIRLLGTCLKESQMASSSIFTVFLQGLPLTGKTCVTNYFKKEGAVIISCSDIIKSSVNKKGEEFLGMKDVFADYGQIIYSCLIDKDKRKAYADCLISRVKAEIKKQIQSHQAKGAKFILIQDSLLLNGNLKYETDEVWSTILPVAEVTKRLNRFYELTEEEVNDAILSMPTNEQYINVSNRVFCSTYSCEITEQQISRAMSEIKSKMQ